MARFDGKSALAGGIIGAGVVVGGLALLTWLERRLYWLSAEAHEYDDYDDELLCSHGAAYPHTTGFCSPVENRCAMLHEDLELASAIPEPMATDGDIDWSAVFPGDETDSECFFGNPD